MKKLLLSFVLVFFILINNSLSNDISSFEIEEFTVGQSLLRYSSENIINNSIVPMYKSDSEYYAVSPNNLVNHNVFDSIEFHLLRNDKNYIIQMVRAGIFMDIDNDFQECENIRDAYIGKIIKNNNYNLVYDEYKLNRNNVLYLQGKVLHPFDQTGKSVQNRVEFNFYSDFSKYYTDAVSLECMDWSDKIEEIYGYKDHFSMSAGVAKIYDWVERGYP